MKSKHTRPRFSFLLILLCLHGPLAQASNLYLRSELESGPAADSAIRLIQCAFEKGGLAIEVLNPTESALPLLALSEKQGRIFASLAPSSQHRFNLGSFELSDNEGLCQAVLQSVTEPAPARDSEAQMPKPDLAPQMNSVMTATPSTPSIPTEPVSGSSFFKRNWPYLAIATVIATGAVILLSQKKNSSSPDEIFID